MKKPLAMIIGLSLTSMVLADPTADVLKKLEELQRQVDSQKAQLDSQKAEIADLRKRINETGVSRGEVSAMVKQELDRSIDTTSKDAGPSVVLSNHIKKLKISGDARFRWERQEREFTSSSSSSDDARDRLRTRLRLNFLWDATEDWEIGVGLASGGEAGTSTNDTWSENKPFETGDLRLDHAYAKHKWEGEGHKANITVGQMKNPFVTSDVLWDGDLRPYGLAGTYSTGGFFVTAGGFEVKWNNREQASSELLAAQVGYKGDIAEGTNLTVATSYYHYNDPTTDNDAANTTPNTPSTLDPGYEFRIADLHAAVDTKMNSAKLGVYGHVWKNFGAESDVNNLITPTTGQLGTSITDKDADEMDMGWTAGLKLGIDRFSFGYQYLHVEADSAPAFLTSSDLGDSGVGTTDIEGHVLSASMKVTKNFSLGCSYWATESIDLTSEDAEGEMYRVDAIYKF